MYIVYNYDVCLVYRNNDRIYFTDSLLVYFSLVACKLKVLRVHTLILVEKIVERLKGFQCVGL